MDVILVLPLGFIVPPPPLGLWSKYSAPVLEAPDLLDDDEDLVVEPCVEAVLRLGQFIGDKLYSQEIQLLQLSLM